MSLLQTIIGWAWATVGTLLFAGQLISTVNFPLAQSLGLQEKTDNVDPLHSRLELMTAWWDVVLLWIPPIAGVLMLLDHALWPAACLIAGGAYVDAGGREAAKIMGLRAHGVSTGSASERALTFCAYAFLIITGLAGIAVALDALI